MSDEIVEQLVEFSMEMKFECLDRDTITRTKLLIVDSFGCGFGGSKSQPAAIACRVASKVTAATPSTILSTGQRTSPDLAAFANGVMIRYLDFNDTFIGAGGGGHPSDLLAPALAATEYARLDGRSLITGLVLGYEIYCALGDTQPQPSTWDQATYAVIAASLMTSKLMGLTRLEMAHALSLAVASHLSIGQIRDGQISNWKACAVPNASRNAIFCGLLAAEGMSGPDQVFVGPRGFKVATGWDFELPAFPDSERGFRINRSSTKRFPAGYFAQSAIEAALAARELFVDVAQVRTIHVETFPSGHRAMGSDVTRWRPTTRETADHSLPFVVALACVFGDVQLEHFEQELYKNREVLSVMDRISVSVGDESTKAWPDEPLTVLHVELEDGRRITTRNGRHIGHHSRAMTDHQQDQKFRGLVCDVAGLPPDRAERLLTMLRDVDNVEDIGTLMAATVV